MHNSSRSRLLFEELEARLNPGDIQLTPSPVAATAGPGLGAVNVVNAGSDQMALNDDNTVGWPKAHFISHDVSFAKTDYIDRVYLVNDTQGITEFDFEDNIINGTPDNWTRVNVQLGFGTGANFIPAAAGELDYDWPDKDSGFATPGWTKMHGQYGISYTTAMPLTPGQSVKLFYAIDVPDYDPEDMPGAYVGPGQYEFTVRTTPGPKPGGASPFLMAAPDLFNGPSAVTSQPVPVVALQPASDAAARSPVTYPSRPEWLSVARSDNHSQQTSAKLQSGGRASSQFVAIEDPTAPEV